MFIIKLIPAVAVLLVAIGYARTLPLADYGQYQSLWVRLAVLGALAGAGIPALMITYPADMVRQLIHSLPARWYRGLGLWLLVWAAVYAWLQYEASALPAWLGALFFLLYVVNALQESVLIVGRKFRWLALANGVYAIAFCIIHWMHAYHVNLQNLVLMLCGLGLVRTAFYGRLLMRFFGNKSAAAMRMPWKRLRHMWLHLGLYDLSQVVFRWLDKFVISLLMSGPVAAVYFNGSMEIPFLPLLLGAVGSSVLLQLAGPKAAGRQASVDIALFSGRLLSCIVLPLFCFLISFRFEAITWLFSDKYLAAVPVFFASLWVLPLRAYSFTTLLQHHQQGAVINKGAALDIVVALALMYPLYQLAGLPGIALSGVLSTWLQSGFYLWHTSRLLGVPAPSLIPWRNWLLKLGLAAPFFLLMHRLLDPLTTQGWKLLWGATACLLMAGGLMLLEWRQLRRSAGSLELNA